MFEVGTKVVRKNDPERNKKWPKKWLDTPITITGVEGDRIFFTNPDLYNNKGWVANRFILASDPAFNPLKRFL